MYLFRFNGWFIISYARVVLQSSLQYLKIFNVFDNNSYLHWNKICITVQFLNSRNNLLIFWFLWFPQWNKCNNILVIRFFMWLITINNLFKGLIHKYLRNYWYGILCKLCGKIELAIFSCHIQLNAKSNSSPEKFY